MDDSCLPSILPRRIRTPPKSRDRSYAQEILEDEERRLAKENESLQKRPIVPIRHDRLDVHSFPADNPKHLNPSSCGGLSGLSHAVDGLRLLCRRPSCKLREIYSSSPGPEHKVHRAELPFNSEKYRNNKLDYQLPATSKTSRWLQHCATATFWSRRRSRIIEENCCDPSTKHNDVVSPLPGCCMKPPRIPHDLTSGAAARAAAATQNEILESVRNQRSMEPKIPRDSESGIGIELRDRCEENKDKIVRKDFVYLLPEELIVHILSYLDATSLTNVELVSRRWHRSASSPHVWKQILCNEFYFSSQLVTTKTPHPQIGGFGLGNAGPDQDWKSMWRARKALNQRWQKGRAAAIYLDGHSDSVYCVQFDEHKILTGSRDRTIRVWDAHTYECVKVLGVPKNSGASVPPLPADIPSRGQRPFKMVFPPSTSPEPAVTLSSLHHQESILCLQYSDEILVTGSSDCTCIVWDIKAGYRPVRQLRRHIAGVLDVCFDKKHIVSCSKDTTICLWDQESGEFLRKLSGHRGPVNAVQMRGELVVSASGDGVAKLWNLTSGLCIKEFLSKDRGMACVEFSLDSRTIFAGGNDQVIYQFDTSTGELVRELKGHRGLVRSLHLDSANGRVVSGSYDTSVKAFDLGSGDNIVNFMGWTTSWILSAKADYRRIIATSQDSRIVIMDFGFELPGIESLAG